MENTTRATFIDGFWSGRQIEPKSNRELAQRRWEWLEGGRISSGMATLKRSENEGRAPATRNGRTS